MVVMFSLHKFIPNYFLSKSIIMLFILRSLKKDIICTKFVQISGINQIYQLKRNLTLSLPRNEIVNLSYVSYEKTEASKKPPVFIFHGIIGSKRQWEAIGRSILEITQRKVVAVDLRNHGESPHTTSHKYTELARDVLKLLEILGEREASFIGHNMGGRTAMCVALMAPQKVAGLQVVDISPTSSPMYYSKFMPKVLIAMKSINFRNPRRISLARSEVRNQLRKLGLKDKYTMRIILGNIKQKQDGTFGWACNVDSLLHDYKHWVAFPEITPGVVYGGPTLFVGGQLTEFIPKGELQNIKALFPKAAIVNVPKAGYNVQNDDPTTFLQLTISFLQDHNYRITPQAGAKT